MSPPTSLSELRRFLGMTNQLGKFTPSLAELTQPLHENRRTGHGDPPSPKHMTWLKQNSQYLRTL